MILYKHDCWEGSGLGFKRWWVQSTNCIVLIIVVSAVEGRVWL